jgi:hypothetical protein
MYVFVEVDFATEEELQDFINSGTSKNTVTVTLWLPDLNPAYNISKQPFKRPAIRKPLARYPVNKPFKIPNFIRPK